MVENPTGESGIFYKGVITIMVYTQFMDDLTIRGILLFILGLVFGILTVYYVIVMRKTVKANRKLYRDYAQKLIPGLSGGIIVIISTQIVSVIGDNSNLDMKGVNLAILIMVLLFFIAVSFVSYVNIEEKYKEKH